MRNKKYYFILFHFVVSLNLVPYYFWANCVPTSLELGETIFIPVARSFN